MTFSRDQLVRAFPDQPLLVAEMEELDQLIVDAQDALDALNAALANTQAKVEGDERWQPSDLILDGVAALKGKAGAIVLFGNDQVVTQPIDSVDDSSLLTKARADSLYGGAGATGSRPTVTSGSAVYFDTTLGKPVFWAGTHWVDATGTTV